MRKFISFFLILIMAFSFASCGKEKAEMYCYSCGKGILKSDAFCSACGASMDGIGKEKEESSQSETQAQTTQPETTTAPTTPATTVHTHSYNKKVTAPTCTKKGYTTYTCSCGDSYKDNYKNAAHSYKNYFCTNCNAFDRAHSHSYLIGWLKENGYKGNGSYAIGFTDNDVTYALMYEIENDVVLVLMYSKASDWFFTMYLSDSGKNFDYSYRSGENEIKGKVNAKTFTRETVVGCDEFYGLSSNKETMKEMASATIRMAVHFIKLEIINYSMDITIADVGFESYK